MNVSVILYLIFQLKSLHNRILFLKVTDVLTDGFECVFFLAHIAVFITFVLSEYLPEFAIAQLANPTLAAGNGHVGKVTLVLYHLVDALLESILGDEAVNEDVLMLADAVGTIGSLCLNGGVPPEVIMYDMTCSGEIETSACGFQRQ